MNILEWVELRRDIDETITWPSQHKYQVSNFWTIRAYKRKWWFYNKPSVWSDWYPYMNFKQNKLQHRFKISRLVAWAFLWLDIYNRTIFVCHIDDNRMNSNLSNLFLWSDIDNKIDMYIKNRHIHWFIHPFSKYTKSNIIHVYSLYKAWLNYSQIAKLTGITKSYVRVLCLWKAHTDLFNLLLNT